MVMAMIITPRSWPFSYNMSAEGASVGGGGPGDARWEKKLDLTP